MAADSNRFLIRIPEVFDPLVPQILAGLGATPLARLGGGYISVEIQDPAGFRNLEEMLFVRWILPLHHSWPCAPAKMEGFVEKAARALAGKFAAKPPQAILAGPLEVGAADGYYKRMASNLRGRTLQLFPALKVSGPDAEAQDPGVKSLFCLVGKEGLFCGLASPRETNGFYPGGSRFISQAPGRSISRAGAKIAEALHYLRLHGAPPAPGSHWLELGASPGGMTAELLDRKYRVTAVDRADLDPRIRKAEGVKFVRGDVNFYRPEPDASFDAILCDMNGGASESIRQVCRLSQWMREGGLVVFTLKNAGAETVADSIRLFSRCVDAADAAGLDLVARTHLTYNREEFTLIFEKRRGR